MIIDKRRDLVAAVMLMLSKPGTQAKEQHYGGSLGPKGVSHVRLNEMEKNYYFSISSIIIPHFKYLKENGRRENKF